MSFDGLGLPQTRLLQISFQLTIYGTTQSALPIGWLDGYLNLDY
jgi:hypothetical protein